MLRRLFVALGYIFCVAYPLAVIGIAFDVKPPFSLAWAGSALLFLEGMLLILAAMLLFGWLRGLFAGLLVIVLSYLVETIGVNSGFPFGIYRYTQVLLPHLPGGVPLAVMFAWTLIVFGSYAWVSDTAQKPTESGIKRHLRLGPLLLGGLLAMLLDLEIEPVATYLEHYWQWFAPGHINYYGVPLANFAAWFVIACLLLLMVNMILADAHSMRLRASKQEKLALLAPRMLFALSLFMFGLIDLTHGYYLAVVPGLLAGCILYILSSLPRRPRPAVTPAHRVQ